MAPVACTARPQQATALAAGVALAVAAGAAGYAAWIAASRRRRHGASSSALRVRILYGTVGGTTARWAERLSGELREALPGSLLTELVVEDLATFAFDSLLVAPPKSGPREVVLILLSTQAEGAPPPQCEHFCRLLEDHVHDFRVGKTALAHLSFAVLGFGSQEYEPAGHYCTAAANVDVALGNLSALRLLPLVKVSDTLEVEPQVESWSASLPGLLVDLASGKPLTSASLVNDDDEDESDMSSSSAGEEAPGDDAGGDDLEELADSCGGSHQDAQEMVTSKHRAQLTKEGYKIIGSHSAVKLCRWTKHQLRGRGGCYKHSFYGITSFQCMEATPSLACANKCVFCWRHHKNPVGTSWKWKMDPPDAIVAEGIDRHRQMIRECKGIPGVRQDRFDAAMTVRHCALSLVGEPIMYPRINELVGELHKRRISTFLVTNAQFPEAIVALNPVTQLYVSVDAATPEALKDVDRPLFRDFWERYISSLRALKAKQQRTVYRLTLVKGHNMASARDYAKLVGIGEPDFIEIKSVTFCGVSKASSLSFDNVPWHEEVKTFTEAMLGEEGLSSRYALACEHQHSCIVLLAHRKYHVDGRWHTWIDYDRFHELVESGSRDFTAMDYAVATPDWALYGSEEAGFDPSDTRVYHNRTKKRAKAGLLSDVQLRHYPTDPAAD